MLRAASRHLKNSDAAPHRRAAPAKSNPPGLVSGLVLGEEALRTSALNKLFNYLRSASLSGTRSVTARAAMPSSSCS